MLLTTYGKMLHFLRYFLYLRVTRILAIYHKQIICNLSRQQSMACGGTMP